MVEDKSQDDRPSDHTESRREKVRGPASETPHRRRRRWLIRVPLVVSVLGLVLIAGGPWLLSTRFATQYACSYASGLLRGSVDADRLSVGWFTPTELRGLHVRDSQRRTVVKVDTVTVSSNLWRLLSDPFVFDTVTVQSPEVSLLVGDDGIPTFGDAFDPADGPPEGRREPASKLPSPSGLVTIEDGAVTLTRRGDAAVLAGDLNVEVTLDSLNDIDVVMALMLAEETPVTLNARVAGAAPSGVLDLAGATGSVSLDMGRPVTLSRVAGLAVPELEVSGQATVHLKADIEPGRTDAAYGIELVSFGLRELTGSDIRPLDAAVSGTASLAGDTLDVDARLSGTPGTVQLVGRANVADGVPDLDTDQLVAAVFGAAAQEWPSLTLTLDGNIDLEAVKRAVPNLLVLDERRRLASGSLEVASVKLSTGKRPSLTVSAALTDLIMADGGKKTAVGRVSLDADASLVPDQGLAVDHALVKTGFGSIQASGNLDAMTLKFDGDLSSAIRELGPVVSFGNMTLSGTADASVTIERLDERRLAVRADVAGRRVIYGDGERTQALGDVRLTQRSTLELKERRPVRLDVAESTLNVDDVLAVNARVSYDLITEAITAQVAFADAEIGKLGARSAMFGLDGIEPYGGTVASTIDVSRDGPNAPWRADGSATLDAATLDGRPLLDGRTTVTWSQATIDPDVTAVTAATVAFRASVGTTEARNFRYTPGDGTLRADVTGDADLKRLSALYARLSGEPPAADVRGRLLFDAEVGLTDQSAFARGRATSPELSVHQPDGVIRERDVALTYDVTLDHAANRLQLARTELKTPRFTASAGGKIDNLDSDMTASLRGRYSLAWKDATKLLNEWMPATATLVQVEGVSDNEFQILGPLAKADLVPAYREAHASTRVTWEAADILGVVLGTGTLEPELSGGTLIVPKSTIEAGEGRVVLGGSVDLTETTPRLVMPGRTAMLQSIALTPELCRNLLSRINPIFYEVASAQGSVDLMVNDVDMPLSKGAKRSGGGTGRLDFVDMKMVPAGFLAELLALGGIVGDERVQVRVSGLDFVMRAGRIEYRNFALRFPGGFDLNFFGSVGINGSLALSVSVPVRAALLERLGVDRRTSEYAEALSGARVDIPVSGTRDEPVLEMWRIDVQSLIERATQGAAERVIGDLLDDVLRKNDVDDDRKQDKKKKKKRRRRP